MTDFSDVLSQTVQGGDDKKVVQLVKEADILEKYHSTGLFTAAPK